MTRCTLTRICAYNNICHEDRAYLELREVLLSFSNERVLNLELTTLCMN